MENLAKLLVSVESGGLPGQALVDWAIREIEAGNESVSLNELAWLTNPASTEAIRLFIATASELNYSLPTHEEKLSLLANNIASKMEGGNIDLNEGCTKLCEISRCLGSPEYLSVFELLAHEQYDHENLGITADSIRPEIAREVNRLLNET